MSSHELQAQVFLEEVSQCLVDQYVITYQNIWGEDMFRLHLEESSYCKILVPLKGTSSLNLFLHKKCFFNSCYYTKKNFKNTKIYKYFQGEGAVRPLGERSNVTSIQLISCKSQFFADEILKCFVHKYQMTYQNI